VFESGEDSMFAAPSDTSVLIHRMIKNNVRLFDDPALVQHGVRIDIFIENLQKYSPNSVSISIKKNAKVFSCIHNVEYYD